MHTLLLVHLLLGCGSPVQGEAVGLVRLTSTQWELSTAELLGRSHPSGLSDGFVPDPATGTFDNNASELVIGSTLWQQQQAAAVELAGETVGDDDLYEAAVGLNVVDAGAISDRDAWLARFGRRAFRRDLTTDEITRYTALFDTGSDVFTNRSAFVGGVQLSIVGFLQSPHFLYRIERTVGEQSELVPISFASKLSFSLWNAPPDNALLVQAEGAGNSAALLSSVPRMLEDDRAHDMVRDLHRQLFHVENFANIPRDFVSYEDYGSTVNGAMEAEVDAFVEEVVFSGGTVADLLTSRLTFADSQIAEIYGTQGVRGSGADALQPIMLEPTERAGLFTLSGFLAVHSSESAENLIRRSAFVHESMLCTSMPPPPPGASALPPAEADQTTRDRIDEHTAECGGACHTDMLNPIAFAFGQYDEWGRYRDSDQIDASSTYQFSFGDATFDGAVELAELMADDEDVHRCYASHLFSYLEGRSLSSEDDDRLDALTSASMDGEPILGLITDIVVHAGFREAR